MLRKAALLVVVTALILFVACSKAGNESSQSQAPAGQQSASQAPASQPPAAQPPAVQQAPAQAKPAEAVPRPEAAPARAESPKAAASSPAKPAAPAAEPGVPVPAASNAAAAKAAAPVSAAAQPVEAAATPVPPPPPPSPKPLVLASGTRFEIRLIDPISSAANKTGDTFKASLDQDLEADGQVVAPKGSVVTGKLSGVKPSGRVEGVATLSMTLTEIAVGKASYAIQTNTLSFEAEKTTKQDATKVGIGAAAGAIIGAIAGGGKGAAIGAAVGGAAGAGTVLATKGKEVQFKAEERFSFVLRSNLEIKR